MLCFFRCKNTLFIFAEIVSRKIVSQHPFVARGIGCVDVQLPELHQHFVAVVVGHEVTEVVDVALQRVVEPVGGGALDIDFGAGRPSALGGHTVPWLAVTHSVLAEDSVDGHLEAHGLQISVTLPQHVAHLRAQPAFSLAGITPGLVGVRSTFVLDNACFRGVKTYITYLVDI